MNGYPPGAIWPAEDKDSVQIREVYSRYGLAMYQAQVLEHGMVNAVIIARMLPTMHGYRSREYAHRDGRRRRAAAHVVPSNVDQLAKTIRPADADPLKFKT